MNPLQNRNRITTDRNLMVTWTEEWRGRDRLRVWD